MRAISVPFLLLAGSSLLTVAGAQQPPAAVCKFDHRTAEIRWVTGRSEFNLDPVIALQHRPWFATGETVRVSKQQRALSCATFTVETAKGWVTESGWIASSRLERVESAKAGPVK